MKYELDRNIIRFSEVLPRYSVVKILFSKYPDKEREMVDYPVATTNIRRRTNKLSLPEGISLVGVYMKKRWLWGLISGKWKIIEAFQVVLKEK